METAKSYIEKKLPGLVLDQLRRRKWNWLEHRAYDRLRTRGHSFELPSCTLELHKRMKRMKLTAK